MLGDPGLGGEAGLGAGQPGGGVEDGGDEQGRGGGGEEPDQVADNAHGDLLGHLWALPVAWSGEVTMRGTDRIGAMSGSTRLCQGQAADRYAPFDAGSALVQVPALELDLVQSQSRRLNRRYRPPERMTRSTTEATNPDCWANP